jgi:DAK2 domain fusion protein YloV
VTLDALRPGDLSGWMAAYEQALADHRVVINRLNVYPVPDGDTGTNMHLTLESVNRELRQHEGAGMAETAKAVSHGSLMGARGNSGVILCQILRGIAAACAPVEAVGPRELAKGFSDANEAARSGVMRPVEGTILTVAAEAAAAARAVVDEVPEADLLAVAGAARAKAVEALHRTPEMLPVLASAGVVDAGGAGLVLLFDAVLHVIDGRPLPSELPLPDAVAALLATGQPIAGRPGPASAGDDLGALADEAHARAGEEGDVSSLRYEVMYFLEAPDESVPAFKEVWAGIGDSIVVVGGEGLWNCHIHTDDIGAAIEAGIDAGRPCKIRVTDLLDQVEEESWVRRAEAEAAARDQAAEAVSGPTPVTSVVAVATGDGIRRIFHSLGVRHVVAGGQSMNPSTAQILDVVEQVPGEEVVILPNNSNIFPVAAQACQLAGKRAVVVDTPGIQEGFAALLEYDPQADAATNASAMSAAAQRVAAGEVTQAVRGSDSPAGRVEAGDWIGLARSGIVAIAPSAAEATTGLLAVLLDDGCDIVTLIEGAGARPAETRRITEWMAEHHPGVPVELHHGGQPLYPYLVSAE